MKGIFLLALTLLAFAGCNTKNNSISSAPDISNKEQNTIAVGGPQQTTGSSPAPAGSPSPTP